VEAATTNSVRERRRIGREFWRDARIGDPVRGGGYPFILFPVTGVVQTLGIR
jgi:hypothetical protein